MSFANITAPIEHLPMAMAVAGPDLVVQWANQYLRENLPYLDIPDLIPTLLAGYDMEEVRCKLETSSQPATYRSQVPLLSTVVTLSPIHEEGAAPSPQSFQGAIIHVGLFNQSSSPLSLEQANRVLFEFNSHFRNPLSSIFAALSNISRQLEIEECYSCGDYLGSMTQNCYKMLRTCISVTEYSRYCNGLAVLNKKVVGIVEFTKNLLDSAAILARKIGASITYTLPEEEQYLICDPEKLSLALFCILSNSCCYFEGETKIHVLLEVRGNTLHFRITDTGYGIPDDVMPHIFEPYYSRGKDEFTFPGLGLGLPLAKMIVSHHGGTLAVFSQQDEGTTVAFTLPIEEDQTGALSFLDPGPSYILDRFSNLYIFLSDVLPPPKA